MAAGGGSAGGAQGIEAGRAFVRVQAKNEVGPGLKSAGLDVEKFGNQAKSAFNESRESAVKLLKSVGADQGGLLGQLLGGVEGLGGLSGLLGILGPQGLLVAGGAALALTIGKTAAGFDALAAAQERGQQLTNETKESYDRLIKSALAAAERTNDLATAQAILTGEKENYLTAEREAQRLRDIIDRANKRDPAGVRAFEAEQRRDGPDIAEKLAAAEEDLALKKKRQAEAEEKVRGIREKLTDAQDKVLDQLRQEAGLRSKTAELREAFLKLNPTPERVAEFDQLREQAKYMELTRKESEKGAAAEAARKTSVEQITKALRDQAQDADLSPGERVRRQLTELKATQAEIDQAVKDAVELERVRNRPEAVRRAFRDAFAPKEQTAAELTTAFGGSLGAFQSGGFRQLLGGTGDVVATRRHQTNVETLLANIKKAIENSAGVFS